MRRRSISKSLSVVVPMLVTTILWLIVKFTVPGRTWAETTVPQALTQITSLWSLQLFSIALVISARSRTVERFYGGLDKSYHTHIVAAKVGFFLILLHPILLIPHYVWTNQEVAHLFTFSDFWPRNVGITSYYLFVVLVGLTLWRFMEYQKWLSLHKWLGVPFVLGAIHAVSASSDVRAWEPLRDWVMFWAILGTIAWLYKAFFYREAAQRYTYFVERFSDLGSGIREIVLKPKGRRMNYEPGEFAFVSVRGNPAISPEHHPFSISSSPHQRRLRFSYREVGDYTRNLAALKEGDQVEVYGPYGEFTSYNLDEYKRQIWIAGGIGITPFLSMLGHEISNEDGKQIWIVYDVKAASSAVYDPEIRGHLPNAGEDRIQYRLREGGKEGFLTAAEIQKWVGDLQGVAILMCGPGPMMRSLRKQFLGLGVPASAIFFEEFDFV